MSVYKALEVSDKALKGLIRLLKGLMRHFDIVKRLFRICIALEGFIRTLQGACVLFQNCVYDSRGRRMVVFSRELIQDPTTGSTWSSYHL